MTISTPSETRAEPRQVLHPHRWYVAILLMVVYAFCLVDRQIVTILAGEIKRDLNVSDAEIGLLYGTTFAVFYAIFGIPLGRLADTWSRTKLLALGLASWSAMTTLCGFATNFMQLAIARLGVGIGEASANPASYSLLSDYFPKHQRATALAIYSSGVSIGLGVSLWAGGAVVTAWNEAYPGTAPLGLAGWQAAFVVVGVPGMVLAALVALLREPKRGAADAHPVVAEPTHRTRLWLEFASIVPPFTLLHLAALRANAREWQRHLLALVFIATAAVALTLLTNSLVPEAKRRVLFQLGAYAITGHTLQWTSIGICAYAVYSWMQSLRLRDRPTYTLIFSTPALICLIVAIALNMCITYGAVSWAPFYAVQKFAVSLREIGLKLGVMSTFAGLIGTLLGGVVSDALRRRSPRGRLYVIMFSMIISVPAMLFMLSAESVNSFVLRYGLLGISTTIWLGAGASTTQDLVLPRMRGTSAAMLQLGMTIVGLGIGPYFAGFISDVTGSLRTGMLSVEAAIPVVIVLLVISMRSIERAEATLQQRAAAAGEVA